MKIAAAFAVLALVAGLWGLWQRSEARAARAEVAWLENRNDEMEQALDRAAEARAVHAAHAERLARDLAEAVALEDAITREDGADARASDYLRSLHRRLR